MSELRHDRSAIRATLHRTEVRTGEVYVAHAGVQRAVEIYEVDRLDFADAYLVASAERTGVGVIASFDRSIDRVTTVRRDEPA